MPAGFLVMGLGVLRGGEHRRSETELKMMNSIFIVEFGVPVTHSVENFYSYIYPVLWNSATLYEVGQGEGKII